MTENRCERPITRRTGSPILIACLMLAAFPMLVVFPMLVGGCGGEKDAPEGTAPGTTPATGTSPEIPVSRPTESTPGDGGTPLPAADPDNPLVGRWVIDAELVKRSEAYRRSDPAMQERLIAAATASPVELVFDATTVTMMLGGEGIPEEYQVIDRGKNAVKIVSMDAEGTKTEIDCVIDGDMLHIHNPQMGEMTLRRAN